VKYKIPLVVDGLNLDDDAVLSTIGEHLSDLMWTRENGQVCATIFVDDQHPVMRGKAAAARIRNVFPYACVHRVNREIVGIPEIAEHAGVTAEAVRLWATGKRGPGHFPVPIGWTGGGNKGPSKLWYWGDVNAWLEANYELGDGHRYLSERQHAMLAERLTSLGQAKTVVAVEAPQPVYTNAPSDLLNVFKSEGEWTTVPVAQVGRRREPAAHD